MNSDDPALEVGLAGTETILQGAAADLSLPSVIANNLGLVAMALAGFFARSEGHRVGGEWCGAVSVLWWAVV